MAALTAITAGCGKTVLTSIGPKAPALSPPLIISPPPLDGLTLWYQRPAREWEEALPIGSGRLGAMVHGGVESERLQLNEDTLSSGGPYDPDNVEALPALPEIRRFIFQGKYRVVRYREHELSLSIPAHEETRVVLDGGTLHAI